MIESANGVCGLGGHTSCGHEQRTTGGGSELGEALCTMPLSLWRLNWRSWDLEPQPGTLEATRGIELPRWAVRERESCAQARTNQGGRRNKGVGGGRHAPAEDIY